MQNYLYIYSNISIDSNRYNGWLQDVRVFLIALVNVEIYSLFHGYHNNNNNNNNVSQRVHIQPECRCPNTRPRNVDASSTHCASNEPTTPSPVLIATTTTSTTTTTPVASMATTSRINPLAHPLAFINDNDYETSWISCILTMNKPISIVLDLLNGVYILQQIQVVFSSLPPTRLTIERYTDDQQRWTHMKLFSTDCAAASAVSGSNASCTPLPVEFTAANMSAAASGGYSIVWTNPAMRSSDDTQLLYANRTLVEQSKATKIRLTLAGYNPTITNDIRKLYYAISEIKVFGR